MCKLYITDNSIWEIRQYVNSIFTSDTWIILRKNIAYLIDCGDVDNFLAVLPKDTSIKGVFLTHTHFDHIYGVKRLLELFPSCLVYTSEYGVKGLSSDKLNLSRYHTEGESIKFVSNHIKILKEGDVIPLFNGDAKLIVMETPGHDPSCLSYRIDKCLFTGDAYIPGIKTVTNLPHGNKLEAENSEKRIKEVIEQYKCDIYPGHGAILHYQQTE